MWALVVLGLVAAGCGDGDSDGRVEAGSSDGGEIVLAPTGAASADELERTAGIVRERAAELGEAEVTVRGGRIVVDLQDTDDRDRFADILARSGELRFRPVLAELRADQADPPGLTPPEDDHAGATVTLADLEGVVTSLGPTLATGEMIESAAARLSPNGTWGIDLVLHEGAQGIDQLNQVAAQCNPPSPICPTGRLAIVLDGVVQSAPAISESSYTRDQIQISGNLSESDAEDLALVLDAGALPIDLELEPGGG